MNIPIPSPAIVREFEQKFLQHKNYSDADKSLDLLLQTCPSNTISEHVLLKVVVLNQFYSTQIYDPFSVAKRIIKLGIDQRLAAGDLTLVDQLTPMELGGQNQKVHHLYSFATKYCHWHQPTRFSIFDSYVDRMLLHFRTVNNFDNFHPGELKKYPRFIELLSKFKTCFGLEEFTPKQLDIYLWLGGKEYFSTPLQ